MKRPPQPLSPAPAGLRNAHEASWLSLPRTVSALILREMSGTYGRSPGGYIWALAEPILGIVLLSLIFSIAVRNPLLGTNFAMFYASGLLPFLMVMDLSTKVSQAINYSKQLLAYPRVTLIDAVLARYILNLLTQLLVNYIVFSAIISFWDTRTTFEVDRILMAYAMAAALGLGIGVFNCFLMSLYPIWQRAYNIMTRPLFLMSGVIFIYEIVPNPYREWLWYNPLMHVTGELRGAFYNSYDATYVSPMYVFALSGVLGAFGLLFLWRYHRDIMEM